MQKFVAVISFCFVMFFLGAVEGFAQVNADDIAARVYNRNDGRTAMVNAQMILKSSSGQEIVRTFRQWRKDDQQGLSKTLIRFSSPPDIAGVAFLSWEQAVDDDTQFLFLPELGRARRISGQNKTNSFVNSDFTFEDMQRRKPQDDAHTLLREEMRGQYNTYVVEYKPKNSYQYGKLVNWIDRASNVIVYSEIYNLRMEKVKTLEVVDMQTVGGIWTPLTVVMTDLKRSHQTLLRIDRVQYNIAIEDGRFEKNRLVSDF